MLIPALLAALFLLPREGLAVLVGLIIGLGGHEWARLCKLSAPLAYAAATVALFAAAFFAGEDARAGIFALAAAFWLALVPLWLVRGVPAPRLLAACGFVVLVPAGLAMVYLPARQLVELLVLIWLADSVAYFVGRAVGRHKLAPSISPGKTWEGAAGGAAGAMAWAIIVATFIEAMPWVPLLAAAFLLAVLSIVGDLFESAVKRRAGAKDSGSLLPGHGGVLDRIDSLTSTLPVAALLLPLARSAA